MTKSSKNLKDIKLKTNRMKKIKCLETPLIAKKK